MPKTPKAAIDGYLAKISEIHRSRKGKEEESYYPALNLLLDEIGEGLDPSFSTIPHPAAIDRDHPDVACWDRLSGVLIAPIEVKGAKEKPEKLAKLAQTRRYADSFGAGRCVATNLWSFSLVDFSNGTANTLARVDLLDSATDLDSPSPKVTRDTAERLKGLLKRATDTRVTISKPQEVAEYLGYHAREIVDSLDETPDVERFVRDFARGIRAGLGMDLDTTFLRGTVAQTVAYGVFAGWLTCQDPQKFDWTEAAFDIEIPVVAQLLSQASSPQLVRGANLGRHLTGVAGVLNRTDRDAFTALLAGRAIEYFYEPFLAAFDPELRDKLGVWYTPKEIAEYQVARVHHHLQEDLQLPDGLADDSVFVLDPASGTGTYIIAALELIYRTHRKRGRSKVESANRCLAAVKSRIIGFEILPAAYVIGHLNIGSVLRSELGADVDSTEAFRLYLTNSLDGWGGGGKTGVPLAGLEEQIRKAQKVKLDDPVIAVIGNPPYEALSRIDNEDERKLIEVWSKDLRKGWGVKRQHISDLYVRFWRIAVMRVAEITERGVVSFISNRKWLVGRSFPLMRQEIIREFDAIWVDDLGGDTRAGEQGSVFKTNSAPGIQVGVAVVTAVKTDRRGAGDPGVAFRRELDGTGAEKREQLRSFASDELDAGMEALPVSAKTWWRLAPAVDSDAWPVLSDYFVEFESGVQVRRDVSTAFERDDLVRRMQRYFDGNNSWATIERDFPDMAVELASYDGKSVRERLLGTKVAFEDGRIQRLAYKPFDERWFYWEMQQGLLVRPRPKLERGFFTNGQHYLVQAQTSRRRSLRPLITAAAPSNEAIDPNGKALFRRLPSIEATEGTLAFEEVAVSGIEQVWIARVRDLVGGGSDVELGDQVFAALVAVSYAPSWNESQPDELQDFPTVPLPSDADDFKKLAKLGERIIELTDLSKQAEGIGTGRLDPAVTGVCEARITGSGVVELGSRAQGWGGELRAEELWINEADYFEGVSQEVWQFEIGGFRVLRKWLSYRAGRRLEASDRIELQDIARRISCLIGLESELDTLFLATKANPLESG